MVKMALVSRSTLDGPTDEEIMHVLGLTATSTGQLCDRLRNLFTGRDIHSGEKLLTEMQQRVRQVNVANGWFDEDRSLGDGIALIHSEISEMFEAYRDHGFRDATLDHLGSGKLEDRGKLPKPEGFGSEAADVLVRILDESDRQGWTLDWPTLQEVSDWDYDDFDNQATVGAHIASMHQLTARVEINKLLSYLVTWCRRLDDIHLQEEFERKLAYNATRGHKHGGKLL